MSDLYRLAFESRELALASIGRGDLAGKSLMAEALRASQKAGIDLESCFACPRKAERARRERRLVGPLQAAFRRGG